MSKYSELSFDKVSQSDKIKYDEVLESNSIRKYSNVKNSDKLIESNGSEQSNIIKEYSNVKDSDNSIKSDYMKDSNRYNKLNEESHEELQNDLSNINILNSDDISLYNRFLAAVTYVIFKMCEFLNIVDENQLINLTSIFFDRSEVLETMNLIKHEGNLLTLRKIIISIILLLFCYYFISQIIYFIYFILSILIFIYFIQSK